MRHIVLTGYMGSGKTTLGLILAEKILLPFIDLDKLIELQQGLSIARIFDEFGEPHFRDLESTALQKALSTKGCHVIATGGGILLRPANRQMIKDGAYCLFLDATPEVFLPRIRQDAALRPLAQLANNRELTQRWEERLPFYLETADQRIDAAQPISTSVRIIKEWLQKQALEE